MHSSAKDGRGRAGSQAIGLYYYGARYYDARQGQWISPDPILSKYLGGSGNGGVFNPINLSVYTQSYNNPIRYRDPNGQIPIDTLWDAANVIYDIGKIGVGYATGNTAMMVDGSKDLAMDTGALLIPYVPAGASKILKVGIKYGDEAADSLKAFDKANDARKAAEAAAETKKAADAAEAAKKASDAKKAAEAAQQAKAAKPKQTGSYTNTHESGKTYSGKGGKARSQKSGERVAKENGDPHVATDWTEAPNAREAFKQESRRIDAQGGPQSPANYNKIESPGKKMRRQDGD